MTWTLLAIALAWAASGAAWSQNFYGDSPESGDEVITAHDGRGKITTAYNLFDGANHAIQVTRLNAAGQVVWQRQHANNLYEKAYDAAMDSLGNSYVAGTRREYERKFFLLLKFTDSGYEEWARTDDKNDCTAVSVLVDAGGGVIVAGVCRDGYSFPARVVKFDRDGSRLWFAEYDGGGRNYVRRVDLDRQNNLTLSVETVFGNFRDGSYQTRRVVFDENGSQVEVR